MKWTQQEIDRLNDLSENYTKSDIARLMNRSASSVNNKRRQLEIDYFTNKTDMWTLTQVANAVGLDRSTISKIWCRNGLKSIKRGYYRMFHEEDVIKYMKSHLDGWNARRCDYYLFSRYSWFMKKWDKDRTAPIKQREWTIRDVQRLDIMRKRGLSVKQIAIELNRTERSIKHRLYDRMV